MPTYEYACKSCTEHVEVVQSFRDDPLTTCPACGGPLRKVFGSIGISFKGSGFYKTDSRPKPKSDKAAAASSSSEKAAPSSSDSASGASSGSSDKPAKAPASTSSESSKAAAS